ncbi:MAG: hypothetical protein KA149_08815 [Chitinophagales bacterium]|nr:hypothetical protein [Chitinophagales bacterium]
MNKKIPALKKQIQAILLFFMVALALSGATAIPAYSEIGWLLNHLPRGWFVHSWLQRVYIGLADTQSKYPFLLYGYDWLAFAHFVIAIAFIGPYKNPVKNIWVIEFGMIACVLILPYAFAFCALRGIPYWWTLIDCSFGVFGIIPLWICRQKILEMEKLLEEEKHNLIF